MQSGGSFDIDTTVTGPNAKQILNELKQRQGDYVFTAQAAGEHSFCFTNSASSFASEKMVDMEIAIENESRSASLPQKSSGTSPEQHTALEEAVFRVSSQLSTVNRMQKYFRTRENRNFSTVRSTEGRIFKFSLVEVGMMVGMAGLQVLVVRFFFQGARKGVSPLGNFLLGGWQTTNTRMQVTYKVCTTEEYKCSASVHGVRMETATSRPTDGSVLDAVQ